MLPLHKKIVESMWEVADNDPSVPTRQSIRKKNQNPQTQPRRLGHPANNWKFRGHKANTK
jgi:hypothetical protein